MSFHFRKVVLVPGVEGALRWRREDAGLNGMGSEMPERWETRSNRKTQMIRGVKTFTFLSPSLEIKLDTPLQI